MMYSNKIMEEFYNPENYGVIKGASGVGKVVSDVGSEIIKIYIKVEGDKVTEAQYQTYGGVVAIACTTDLLARMVRTARGAQHYGGVALYPYESLFPAQPTQQLERELQNLGMLFH